MLTSKYNSANAGTRDIGTTNNNDRIAETLYSLGTSWFVSDIYIYIYIYINTLHKGDDDDNDDDDDNNNNSNKFNFKWAVAQWHWL